MKFNPAIDTYVEKSRLRRIWKRLRGHPVYVITKGFSQSVSLDADVKFGGNVMVFGHARHMPLPQRRRWWRWPSKRIVYQGPVVNDFGGEQEEGVMPDGMRWKVVSGLDSIGFEFTSEPPQ